MRSFIPKELFEFLKCHKTYIVGGAVRNYLLPRSSVTKDFDFVIFSQTSTLKEISETLAKQTKSSFVELDKETQTYRIVNKCWEADITAPRGQNIEEDLKARDFTINAMAWDLQSESLIDPLNGKVDLKDNLMRAISKQNLLDDPLRCLRAYRIKSQVSQKSDKSFVFESNTEIWLKELFPLIKTVSIERISQEIWLLMSQDKCYEGLKELFETGVWEDLIPEFKELRKVPPNDFHHLPLTLHTLELIKQYEETVQDKLPSECLKFIKSNAINFIPVNAIVKMGCLLHDIAKPETWEIKEGKHTFYGHDAIGSEMTERIGKRMRWPKAVRATLSSLVKQHLRPFHIAPIGSEPTARAERRFFRKLDCDFYPLIALAWSDLLSTRGPMISDTMIMESEKRLIALCKNYEGFQKQEEKTPLLLNGDYLKQAIKEAGLAPN
ncbi:MAG TPA: HDIG domain-containing metalloprotein, partial [Vampirovibrionales bacterium]